MKIIKESVYKKSNKLILDESLFKPLTEDLSYYQDKVVDLLSSNLVDTVEETDFNGKEAFKLTDNNGKVLYLVPSTLSQVDVYDDQGNVLDTNVFWRYIVDEFIQTEEAGFVYKLVGGDCAGTYTINELKNLPCFDGKYSDDQSEIRNNGGFTHRKELDNQPELNGYLGPMFDGWDKNHNVILRYETQEVYDALSENISTEDEPYTKEQVEQDLKSITNNFTEKEGELKCGFEEEKDLGIEILKQHYKIVEVSGDDRREGAWYHISYAEPKNLKEGFSSNIDLDRIIIDVANLLDEETLGDNWIEVFPTKVVPPSKILLEITGADETTRKAFIYSGSSDNTEVCFGFRYGSEGWFKSAEEIARFIAGEYGIVLNESVDEENEIIKITPNSKMKEIEIEDKSEVGADGHPTAKLSDYSAGKLKEDNSFKKTYGSLLTRRGQEAKSLLDDCWDDTGVITLRNYIKNLRNAISAHTYNSLTKDKINSMKNDLTDHELDLKWLEDYMEETDWESRRDEFISLNESKSIREGSDSNNITLGDTVRVKAAHNRIGTVTKLIGNDVIEVEFEAEGIYPARNDRYYISDVELLDNDLTFCPNCGGTRFNDNTGLCIDCGYDEKAYGDLDESNSIKESFNDYIYLFPELTDDDIKMMAGYNIKYLGMNHGPDGSEDNWVAYGAKEDIEKYAEKYLGYELHPDYLYEYDDFAGDIVEL